MLELLGTVLTGGATGIIGSLLGKAFSFVDYCVEAKKADAEHERTKELLLLQSQIGKDESERELAIAEAHAASDIRMESMRHDSAAGIGSVGVVNFLRLVRPILTFTLIMLVGFIYFNEPVSRQSIEASCLYMMSSAVLWWFGDRALRKKT